MPFIRVTRDKRGYESTLVMHAYRPNGGGQRGRVLYFFRTPSNLQMGRRALDAEVMEALEHTHPDLSFDWTTLLRDPALRSAGGQEGESRRPRERRQPSPRQTAARPCADGGGRRGSLRAGRSAWRRAGRAPARAVR